MSKNDKYYRKYARKVLNRVDQRGIASEKNPDAVDEGVEMVTGESSIVSDAACGIESNTQ